MQLRKIHIPLPVRFSMQQRNLRRIITGVVMVACLMQTIAPTAIAQTASESAQQASNSAVLNSAEPSPTASGNPFAEANSGQQDVPQTAQVSPSSLSDLANSFSQMQGAGNSARVKAPKHVLPLPKNVFTANETINETIMNAQAAELTATLFNADGQAVSASITKDTQGNNTVIQVLPFEQFKPGRYKLKVTDQNGLLSEQDFSWGVLAINTNKSIYTPGETADIAIAVLDERGNVVCDAAVQLTITDPNGTATAKKTDDHTITVNPACQSHAVTVQPDYETAYQTQAIGTYTMALSAVTKNGSYSITDQFKVDQAVPFDVERIAPTRIYPLNAYPVTLKVTANQDYTGAITELVPDSFAITATQSAVPMITFQHAVNKSDQQAPMSLALPFAGNFKETLGFGKPLLDQQERDLYAKYGLAGHDGLDFDMPVGTPVLAADAGKVSLAGEGAYGTTVVVDHSWGRSYYGHLSKLLVKVGDTVTTGQKIALSGQSGMVTGPHLHFGIKLTKNDATNGYYGKTDPTPYFMQLPSMAATDQAEAVLTQTSYQTNYGQQQFGWYVSLKKGQTISLSYTFQAPTVSPQFYTLGPASFYELAAGEQFVPNQPHNLVFQEARTWQIASDTSFTAYITSTAAASPYPTGSWLYSTTANAASNITTFEENKRNTGFYTFIPGTTSSLQTGTVATSLSTAPTNKGFIYTGSGLTGNTTTAGTWTINFKYEVIYTSTITTSDMWYRVLAVSCSAGTCTTNAVISPTDASATAGTGWSKSTLTSLPASSTLSSVQTITFTGNSYTWTSADNLYVEFAIDTSSTGSTSGGWKLETNTSSDSITSSAFGAAPSGPTLDQLMRHGDWFNSSGVRQSFTF